MRGGRFLPVILIVSMIITIPVGAGAADPGGSPDLSQIKREIQRLRQESERDRAMMEKLEREVDGLEQRDQKLQVQNQQLQTANQHLQEQTSGEIKDLQQKVAAAPSGEEFASAIQRYLGSHSFTVAGAAGVDFIFDQQSGGINDIHHASQNSFFADWEPMILYRPTDWILFEGVISTAFGSTGTGVDLSTMEFQIFLNRYMTIVAGLFDQPFGDWYENQSPMWVNRFVTAPLPFGVEPVTPPAEVGLQLRGGMQWGQDGQDWDYTTWVGTGPSFSQPVLGASMSAPSPIATRASNGKGYGARLRFYPIPVDSNMGRLELGASTYDGKWQDGEWFTSWGVDFNYFVGNLQTRGEWVASQRKMPGGLPTDNRDGWYVQLGYFLSNVNVPFLGDELNKYVQRLEPLIRYSGVNQHSVAIDDITGATGVGMTGSTIQMGLIPDFGLNGSPALFAPHSREVAIGLDYWIAPSIVWQNEFDVELPHAGGNFVAADGTATPVGAISNDHAFLSQFTIGF